MTSESLILPRAVLFDMDGTLTEPMLDFPRIKAEMGIGNRPILEALAEMDEAAREIAERILHRHEDEAAEKSALNPGCIELLDGLESRGILTALVTRNSIKNVRRVASLHGLKIETILAREDAPPKPDPHPLRLACRRLGVECAQAWMVGDGQYDVEAGLAAGMATVWVSHGKPRPFDALPWREVQDLWELRRMLVNP